MRRRQVYPGRMDLERSWRRKIFQAAGAGIVAPVAIVGAAVAVGIGGGGLRGLGSLGQTLTGPDVPTAERVDTAAPASSDLLARAHRPTASRSSSRGSSPASSGAGTTPGSARTPSGNNRTPARRPATTTRPGGTGSSPGPQTTPAPQPAPPPQPTPTPSTLRQVGDQIKEVTDPIPVAGGPAGEVIDTIVTTADDILP